MQEVSSFRFPLFSRCTHGELPTSPQRPAANGTRPPAPIRPNGSNSLLHVSLNRSRFQDKTCSNSKCYSDLGV
ncbi:hypothetical protein FKV68_05660 [Sinorhizobium mexicanum]|uniref:Uncharacterized protein n=1 Tax=Sinorhizobium mexicanum TaxID=375549 RepID=A0A859QE31_9HYPH|nr:hypothetical protein FKV68_05660 [Sinorhizobium mexicanum]